MFEQSMLLDHATGKKTGALAASLSAQALGIGVLILLPLIYNDRLPALRAWMSLTLPTPPLARAAEPVKAAATSQSTRPTLSMARIFHMARPNESLSPITPTLVGLDAPTGVIGGDSAGAPIGLLANTDLNLHIKEPPPARPIEAVKPPSQPIHVTSTIMEAKLIKKVIPVYPPLARQARVSGTVHLIGVVAKDGTIQQLQVVSGNPLLVGAALDAVRQWVYRPTVLNNEVVEVIAPIDVIFILSQ
jgi:protein TonB